MTHTLHPAAELFPRMGEQEYAALREDIRKHGILEPILVDAQGRILDGRHRAEIASELGIPCPSVTWDGRGFAVDRVISLNLLRRHLTPGQAAMIADDARPLYEAEGRERMLAGKRLHPEDSGPQGRAPQSRDRAGAAFGVSGRQVDRAREVKARRLDLAGKVRSGEVTLGSAAAQVREEAQPAVAGTPAPEALAADPVLECVRAALRPIEETESGGDEYVRAWLERPLRVLRSVIEDRERTLAERQRLHAVRA